MKMRHFVRCAAAIAMICAVAPATAQEFGLETELMPPLQAENNETEIRFLDEEIELVPSADAFQDTLPEPIRVAQVEPVPAPATAIESVPQPPQFERNTTSESDVSRSKMSVAELRQARALYRAQQRVARLEYNLWMGYEPLRPNWNPVPMTSSRYGNRRVYVPVFVHTR